MKTAQSILDEALKEKSQMDKDILELSEPVMPDSYLEDGVRHAVIYSTSLPNQMRLINQNGQYKIIDLGVF